MISNARQYGLAPWAALLLAGAFGLSACSTTFDMLPEKMGGLPASAPERPAESKAFPNVYEIRPTREAKPLSDDEQKKLESELVTLREEQKQRANPPPPPPPGKKVAAPVKKDPAPEKKKPTLKEAKPAKKKQNDAVVPEQKGPVAAPKLIN
jgi:hypothetical protein